MGNLKRARFKYTIKILQLLWEGSSMCGVSWVLNLFLVSCIVLSLKWLLWLCNAALACLLSDVASLCWARAWPSSVERPNKIVLTWYRASLTLFLLCLPLGALHYACPHGSDGCLCLPLPTHWPLLLWQPFFAPQGRAAWPAFCHQTPSSFPGLCSAVASQHCSAARGRRAGLGFCWGLVLTAKRLCSITLCEITGISQAITSVMYLGVVLGISSVWKGGSCNTNELGCNEEKMRSVRDLLSSANWDLSLLFC